MPVHERRQHFRIDDQVYMDYRILSANEMQAESFIEKDLMGHSNQQYLETARYFEEIDRELAQVSQTLALTDPTAAHYLNLINAKVDYISRNLLVGESISLRKVNISLGGLRFTCRDNIDKGTMLKIVLYTKPKMIPIVVNACCVYSTHFKNDFYSISCQFKDMSLEQEQLLAQHIMHAQVKEKANS
ncbi:PilZ domain-containing protein [Legionella sp. W05-934-2]|uniref:PilZ domain-containing protein n=1 Tax=Legionella sp. W05-934-2 TaxID=1198649 RepID=UPI00346192E5